MPHEQRRNGLSITKPPVHNHGQRFASINALNVNLFPCLKPLADERQITGDKSVHELVGEARRGVKLAQRLNRPGSITGFFL